MNKMPTFAYDSNVIRAHWVVPRPLRAPLPCTCILCSYHREKKIHCHKHHYETGSSQKEGQILSSDL